MRTLHHHLNPLHNPFPTTPSYRYITPQDSRLLHWRSSSSSPSTGGFDDRNFRIHGQTLLYIFILFSIILLAILLLIYVRWFFRLRQFPPPSPPPTPSILLHVTRTGHHQPRTLGLDRSAINLIPIVLYQSSSGGSGSIEKKEEEGYDEVVAECCICLGMFEDGDKVKTLPECHHSYHSECVDVWLCSHCSCPLCRLPVRVGPQQPPV